MRCDLTAFGLTAQSATTQFTTTGTKVGDGEYKLVQGSYAGAGATTFIADSTGNALLVVWDANATGGVVSQVGVVIIGVTTLALGTDLLV